MPGSASQARAARDVDGVLLLDKPGGPSSNQALQRVKRLFGARKAGHAGTLDPMATGLLPIHFGESTKFASYSAEAVKGYEATILLGTRTTSGDVTGEVLEERPVTCSPRDIVAVLDRFRGTLYQIPPMYSAIKQGGQPLYKLARRGKEVERKSRPVQIDELALCAVRSMEVDVRVTCSKGTYIRVLAEDIGEALGCGGTLKRLRRTRVGSFDVKDAVDLEALERMTPAQREAALLPIDAGLEPLPRLDLSESQVLRVRNGQVLNVGSVEVAEGNVRLYVENSGLFLGLGEVAAGNLRPLRLIAPKGREMRQMT